MNNSYQDLLERSLSKISCDLSRLIYLASTREYNTGNYHHDGLSGRYGAEEAQRALRTAHHEVFTRLASASLEELVRQLESYVEKSSESPNDVVHAWQELAPYRVAMPMDANPTAVAMLLSNIKVALKVLQLRQHSNPGHPSGALPPPSLVR
jgi:hypothetical protein